jgi:hypothetical protein
MSNLDINYVEDDDKIAIEHSWSIKLNKTFKYRPKPFRIPRFKEAIKLIPTALR